MSEVAFYPMEADGANYPEAAVPLLPPASWGGLFNREHAAAESAFLKSGESFIQGRYALAEAMRRAGAGPGKAVLLPAFHCRAIVEPALYLGAQPCFYPVMADLRPDFSALSSLVSNGEMPVVAMVITHYFGFPNDIDEAERFCTAHGIALIEDCAHALYGRTAERLLGTIGSYATASVWKFLPARDGALLLDNTRGKPMNRVAQPWLSEAKALAAMLQGWWQRVGHRRSLPVIDVRAIHEQAKLIAARKNRSEHISTGSMRTDLVGTSLKEFSPKRVAIAALCSSRWITAHADHKSIARLRRANYLKWLEGMRLVPGVQPLFLNLPEGVVPYAFPLVIDASGMGFHLLRTAGIPFWRWEDMAVTDCPISRDYRIRVVQLPCHQELREEELDWMIHTTQSLMLELNS